jgi:hypothetical protein
LARDERRRCGGAEGGGRDLNSASPPQKGAPGAADRARCPGFPFSRLGMHIFSSRRNPASRTRCPPPPAFDGFAGQPLAGKHKPGSAVDAAPAPDGRQDYPRGAWRAAKPVSRRLFPLFYLVEIRHCQLLKAANAHPLTGADAREITLRIWQWRGCQCRKSRLFGLSPRPTMGNVLALIAQSLPIPEAERGIALCLRGRGRGWRGSAGRVRSVTPLFRTLGSPTSSRPAPPPRAERRIFWV